MSKFYSKISLIAAIAIFSACADQTSTEPKNLPIVEMVATHAFDTKTQISSLTFIPNNVAPWLGRIIMLDENQHLFSTDIEGRTPLVINPQAYKDVAGLFRKNAAGVFLAVNENNTLEAFVQSDDAGNFTSLPVSGTGIKTAQFCRSSQPSENKLQILALDGTIRELEISVLENILEFTETSTSQATQNNTCQENEGIVSTPLKLSGTTYESRANGNLRIHQADGANQYLLMINDGLSIQGLSAVDYINATTANYGGGAFKNGVIALIDNNKPRIVFVSLEYAGEKITEAQSSQ